MIRTATARKTWRILQTVIRLIALEITRTLNNFKRKELETVLSPMLISKF